FETKEQPLPNGFFRALVKEISSGDAFEIAPGLPGRFQLQNALNALAAARELSRRGFRISAGAISDGIATTVWPGRLEKLQSDRKSTRLNSSHVAISYAVFCLKKKKTK